MSNESLFQKLQATSWRIALAAMQRQHQYCDQGADRQSAVAAARKTAQCRNGVARLAQL